MTKKINNFDEFVESLKTGSKKSNFSVHSGTDIALASHVPFAIPTRIPALDFAIQRNGWPAGRIVEIYGNPHTGKSCVGYATVASVQRMGGIGVWVDAEACWDPKWAALNGVDPTKVIVIEADSIEGMFESHEKILEVYPSAALSEKRPLVVVTDSITGVPSLETMNREIVEGQRLGTDAKAIRNGLRRLNHRIAQSKALFIFINHLTASMAAMQQDESAGGKGLKFYASLRAKLTKMKTRKEDNIYEGIDVKMEITKNKISQTKERTFVAALLKNGFDLHENVLEAFITLGVVTKVNLQSLLWEPNKTQFRKKEWRTFVNEHTEGIDALYDWLLKKAAEMNMIQGYGE